MIPQPVALVTGGSRGIGRGICLELAQAGFAVAINYHGNETAARETQSLLGDVPALLCQADVSQSDDRRRMLDLILQCWQRIDVLVNNAGITSVGRRDLLDATEESWDRVLGTNLKGPFFLSQQVALEMLKLKGALPESMPAIVNISSVSAYVLSTQRGDYCISKAGLSMLTQLFAFRLAEQGIRVYEVRPGIIATDMTADAHERYTKMIAEGLTPIRRWGTPQDVGRAVVALIKNALPYSTGEIVNVDGGFHLRAFPR